MRIFLYLILISPTLLFCNSEESEPIPEAPSVFIDPISIVEGEEDKSVFVSIRLSKPWDSQISATIATIDDTAHEGDDYIGISDKLISFAPGEVRNSIQITIKGDSEPEESESFKVRIIAVEGAVIGNDEAVIEIENDDFDFAVDIPTRGYTTPLNYDGMELIWNDEFVGEMLNEDFWTYEIGNGSSGWGNNELQYYRKENTFIQDEHLVIQARQENFAGFSYTSSRLITKDKFEFTHGRVDIRALLPKGQGIWPALWMLGANISDVGWPRCGEIDIMELVGHEPSTVHGTVHYPNPDGNRIFVGDKISLSGGKKFSDEFHVFSIIWEEDKIEWLMDDQRFYSVTRNTLGTQNPYPFNDPFFFIFNVAVGGQWPGSPDASTSFPQAMIVDYIRVFQ